MGKARIVAAMLVVVAVGCGEEHQTISVTGSSTMAPLVAELGLRFEATHRGVRVDVQTGGSNRGITDARRGLADIGMVSRSLTSIERDLKEFTIARDGVALIVHADNPVTALDGSTTVSIFRGELRNWHQIGGDNREITVVNKAEGRSTLEVFLAHFGLNNSEINADVVIGDNEQGIKTVAGNRGAIGYVSVGSAEVAARAGVSIRLVTLDGVEATSEAVGQGRFPISRSLNLVTAGEPTEAARQFIEFCLAVGQRDLIEGFHFVSLSK